MPRLATVIGAAGFVGGRLKDRLASGGWEVFAPARGDPELLRRDLGIVFYCAGLTADFDRRPFDTVEAHASLVSRVAEAGRFERIVYTSSTRLYDGASGDVFEDQPLRLDPADARRTYDLSKALGENLVLTRTGGRGAVARLSNVYDWAPGSPGFLSEWLVRARGERDLTLASSPDIARDYIHLDDVVAGLMAMAQTGTPPGVVNLCSGMLATNADIAAVFAARGWRVAFEGEGRWPSPPNARNDRLRSLGVRPRPVQEVVNSYLEGLA